MLTGAFVELRELLAFASHPTPRSDRHRGQGMFAGDRTSRNRGRGIDFEEVRLYQPGDDVRNIDWNVTARKQVPHTKIFREERERPTLLIVDQGSSMFFGSQKRLKSVAAAELAARLAWLTLAYQDRIGGIVLSDDEFTCIKPHRSTRNVARLLLAIVERNRNLAVEIDNSLSRSDKAELWDSLLTQLQRITPANNRIILISDLLSIGPENFRRFLGRSRHNRLEVIHVYDELERELPPPNIYSVTDGRNALDFDSSSKVNRDAYTERFDSLVANYEQECLDYNVVFKSTSTVEEPSGRVLDG